MEIQAEVAGLQARQGDLTAASKTAEAIQDAGFKAEALSRIAHARSRTGRRRVAHDWAARLDSPREAPWPCSEWSKASSHAGEENKWSNAHYSHSTTPTAPRARPRPLPTGLSGDYPVTIRPGLTGVSRSSLAWKGSRPMEVLACLNGETMPVEQARVSVWDRGFLFGDSVYEVFRMYRGRCWLEPEHFARLRRSLKELDFPPYDLEALADRMHRLIAASGIQDGTAYIQITRGVAPGPTPSPTRR